MKEEFCYLLTFQIAEYALMFFSSSLCASCRTLIYYLEPYQTWRSFKYAKIGYKVHAT